MEADMTVSFSSVMAELQQTATKQGTDLSYEDKISSSVRHGSDTTDCLITNITYQYSASDCTSLTPSQFPLPKALNLPQAGTSICTSTLLNVLRNLRRVPPPDDFPTLTSRSLLLGATLSSRSFSVIPFTSNDLRTSDISFTNIESTAVTLDRSMAIKESVRNLDVVTSNDEAHTNEGIGYVPNTKKILLSTLTTFQSHSYSDQPRLYVLQPSLSELLEGKKNLKPVSQSVTKDHDYSKKTREFGDTNYGSVEDYIATIAFVQTNEITADNDIATIAFSEEEEHKMEATGVKSSIGEAEKAMIDMDKAIGETEPPMKEEDIKIGEIDQSMKDVDITTTANGKENEPREENGFSIEEVRSEVVDLTEIPKMFIVEIKKEKIKKKKRTFLSRLQLWKRKSENPIQVDSSEDLKVTEKKKSGCWNLFCCFQAPQVKE